MGVADVPPADSQVVAVPLVAGFVAVGRAVAVGSPVAADTVVGTAEVVGNPCTALDTPVAALVEPVGCTEAYS